MMDATMEATMWKVRQLMEGESLSLILNEIKNDIALSIVHTNFDQKAEREELYMLTRAFNVFEAKLQEYVNVCNKIQEND